MISANSMSILKVCTVWRDARWTQGLRNWGVYAAAAFMRLRALAPYAVIELVLPGGSLVALLLWLYRRRKNGIGFGPLPPKSWRDFVRFVLATPRLLSGA
jgi:O-antigen/teichoic acid export membrane protein